MSIQSEITRISENVSDALTAVANKGVTVPAGSNSDDLATLIGQISTGSSVNVESNKAATLTGGTTEVTPSAGYDAMAKVTATVANGTVGTPTATKGAVSSNSVTVTPSVTNTTGYITGSTITGTGVTVSASELVSGTYNVTSSGTKDVTNYASASVPSQSLPTSTASSATSGYTSKATVSRSTSDQYINIPTGFNNAGAYYKVNAVANGSATPASSISASGASVSTGTNTLTLSKTISNTPQVTAGYVSSGTAGNTSVSLTANFSFSTIRTGSGAPASSLGVDGDIYIQTS